MNSNYSSRSGGRSGDGGQNNGSGQTRKVYRSKMTDAYSISELGESQPDMLHKEYFEDTAIHLLGEINVLFEKIIHYYFTPYGLTYVQIPVLMILLKEGPMTVSQLGRTLEIGSSNITPLCKRLETAGLVRRTRDTVDQRVVHVSITEHAKELLMGINRHIKESTAADVVPPSREDQETIARGMTLLRDYMGNIVASSEKTQKDSQIADKRKTRLEAAKRATELSESKRRRRTNPAADGE